MTDRFFTQKTCDRCGGSLKGGRTMSMYDDACICIDCKRKEMERKDYVKAVTAEHNAIKQGNYNFVGIGYEEE